MKRRSVLAAVTSFLVAAPLLAGPPVKRPYCQVTNMPARDLKRTEPCRKPPIPPIIDRTPLYLVSTSSQQPIVSDLS